MTPADPTPEKPLPHPEVNTIPGLDPAATNPEVESPGFRNPTRPFPLPPATTFEPPAASPAFTVSAPPRREIPLCCWVAVISSLTSVVLAAMLWLRPPVAPAAPALAPQASVPAAPAPPVVAPASAPGSPQAFQAALQPYLQAAAAGDTSAMRMLGTMYYHGLDLPRNREEGLKWYRKAAASGSKVAKEELKQLE